jgi:homocysteine S-methyltransferase
VGDGTSGYGVGLPQLGERIFLTDGGLETTLIFHDGIDLPYFAAFPLLDDVVGRQLVLDYYRRYLRIAAERGVGFVAETPTWRANPDWGDRLGYDDVALADVNRRSVDLLVALRDDFEAAAGAPFVVSGAIGPRDDAYRPRELTGADDAAAYHAAQIEAFRAAGADLVTAFTLTHPGEAVGVARAARAAGMPVVISFTVETDGTLPSGQSLADAIAEVDADGGPDAYMLNCAHPSHFEEVLADALPHTHRIRGLRANASRRSHAELDESDDLDAGDPVALAADYARLRAAWPGLTVLGGCCGTDDRHVAEIARACLG